MLAKAIEVLKGDDPKVIAVDVLFADPTTSENDDALARSIADAGNVVLSAQLVDSRMHGGPATWLMPMPALARAAAGVGHVNVQVESEGAAREIAVQAADDAGKTLRALPIEAVWVGDQTPELGVTFTGRSLIVGERTIPLETSPAPVLISQSGHAPARLLTGRMTIDYIGPRGSFQWGANAVCTHLPG